MAKKATKRSMGIKTMARTPTTTSETPFCLAFRREAIIPVEVGLTSNRLAYHEGKNKEGIHLQLDL